eukprot:scaffold2911_cov414-Prasinococcus_capsulatus_cf.AAC.55
MNRSGKHLRQHPCPSAILVARTASAACILLRHRLSSSASPVACGAPPGPSKRRAETCTPVDHTRYKRAPPSTGLYSSPRGAAQR